MLHVFMVSTKNSLFIVHWNLLRAFNFYIIDLILHRTAHRQNSCIGYIAVLKVSYCTTVWKIWQFILNECLIWLGVRWCIVWCESRNVGLSILLWIQWWGDKWKALRATTCYKTIHAGGTKFRKFKWVGRFQNIHAIETWLCLAARRICVLATTERVLVKRGRFRCRGWGGFMLLLNSPATSYFGGHDLKSAQDLLLNVRLLHLLPLQTTLLLDQHLYCYTQHTHFRT